MKVFPIFLYLCLLGMPATSQATWSIVKLDESSRSIVVAGASCSFMVYGIASVVPGKGVAIVQAGSNQEARAYATSQIGADEPLDAIFSHITNPMNIADAADQQYALLSFEELSNPLTFTGENVTGWRGTKTAPGLSVQANTMVSEKVVEAAFEVMLTGGKSELRIVELALAALRAGSEVGGDKRCGEATASSAFISLYRATDNASMPYLNLVVYGIEDGKENAVTRLENLFTQWRDQDTDNRSSQRFIVP